MSAKLLYIKEVSQTKYDKYMSKKEVHSIKNWIITLQNRGIITFSTEDVKKQFPDTLKMAPIVFY